MKARVLVLEVYPGLSKQARTMLQAREEARDAAKLCVLRFLAEARQCCWRGAPSPSCQCSAS